MKYDKSASQGDAIQKNVQELLALEQELEELKIHPEPLSEEKLFKIVSRDVDGYWLHTPRSGSAWYWCIQTHQGLIPLPWFYAFDVYQDIEGWQWDWIENHGKEVREYMQTHYSQDIFPLSPRR